MDTPYLQIYFEIRTPGELKKAIKVAKDNLRDGTLEQVSKPSTVGDEILQHKDENVQIMPDYLEVHFRCIHCGKLFRLEAETYHGNGGSWSVE